MRPFEFITKLQTHYSKRHASEATEKIWLDDMMKVLENTAHDVLDEAYDLIVEQHTERAFPLPAQLRKYIATAAEILHPESKRLGSYQPHYNGPSKRAPDTPEEIERVRQAREWQHATMKEYGTWANWWRHVKHNYQDNRTERRAEAPVIAVEGEKVDWQSMQKPGFEAIQRGANAKLHRKAGSLTERSRRMQGDSE
jgi:hypothetical protein